MRRDPVPALLVPVAFVLRMGFTWGWGFGHKVRDEAQYANLAQGILDGDGMGTANHWLWAPGYPHLLAALRWLFPETPASMSLPWLQAALGALTVWVVYGIARELFDRRSARIAALLYALNPTLWFFAGRFWCEAVYGPVLLLACGTVLWARSGRAGRAALTGLLVGLCVLLRGVAQVLPPLFALALVWPVASTWGDSLRERWKHAAVALLVTTLTVTPWSVHASARHGGLIVSDATVGNLMYLGNNDFQPVTFDYGNGLLDSQAMKNSKGQGRRACKQDNPVQWNRCEVDNGLGWIAAHPAEFLRRMPYRVAQLLNPHSFLTRAVRWGKFTGMPWAVREGLVALTWASSLLALWLGTIGIVARGRGPFAALSWAVVLSTVAASAALYGMTRFRVPVEPLWMLYAASVLAHPRQTLAALEGARLTAVLVLLPLVLGLSLWFLPAGYPGFNW